MSKHNSKGALGLNTLLAAAIMATLGNICACVAEQDGELTADLGDDFRSNALKRRDWDDDYDPNLPFDPHPPLPPLAPVPLLEEILLQYNNYDRDGDGIDEINSIVPMEFEDIEQMIEEDARLLIVFVEKRLLNTIPNAEYTVSDLIDRLRAFDTDLVQDGYHPIFLVTDVYGGARHQDGLTLLAMRDFLISVWEEHRRLAGTLLIGAFPEATLVRSWLWVKKGGEETQIDGVDVGEGEDYLSIIPERVDTRANIVLGDLNGLWDTIYRRQTTAIETIEAVPDPSMGNHWFRDGKFRSQVFELGEVEFVDFFWIRDADYFRYPTENFGGDDGLKHARSSAESFGGDSGLKLSGFPTEKSGDDDDLVLQLNTAPRNPELASADRLLANPIARPEITVSRINARHIAMNPDQIPVDMAPGTASDNTKSLRGEADVQEPVEGHREPNCQFGDGFQDEAGYQEHVEDHHDSSFQFGKPSFLDEAGFPQSVERLYNPIWKHDAGLEREILVSFFLRNTRFRHGAYNWKPFRAGAATYDEEGAFDQSEVLSIVEEASDEFAGPYNAGINPSLVDVVEWYKKPVTLRAVMAHSGPTSSEFGSDYDPVDLKNKAGGRPWQWKQFPSLGITVPSFQDQGGRADYHLFRTLWENRVLANATPTFIVHGGCQVNAIDADPQDLRYNDVDYGQFQNGESHLFFLNGLAMISRAKSDGDFPVGLAEALRPNTPFGAVWHATFRNDSKNRSLKQQNNIARAKKAYNWSLTGDWTLRLRYPEQYRDFREIP